jgi:hypothetical protein
MANQVQWRGGTTANHAGFTGAPRELTVDTSKNTVVVHDGVTPGGHPLLNQDLSNLSAPFYQTGAASGTSDAIISSFSPAISSLTNGQTVFVRAASANATTTPTFTPNSGTVAAATIVKGANFALAPGDIAGAGHWLELQYDQTLAVWVLQNPATGIATYPAIVASSKNLICRNDGTTPNSKINLTADEVILKTSAGVPFIVSGVSVSAVTSSTGAGGLDTGSVATSTFYAVWVISNATTTALLLSVSFTAPALPTGYVYKALVGALRTDGSSNLIKFNQFNSKISIVATNVLANVSATSAGTFQSLSVSSVLPAIAKRASGIMGSASISTAIWTSIADDINGTGKQEVAGPSSAGVADGYSLSATFNVQISSAQNIFWTQGAASGTARIDITGYEI